MSLGNWGWLKLCCCGCRDHCCHDFNLEDTTLLSDGYGPGGGNGCPDIPLCRDVECFAVYPCTLDVGTDAEINELMAPDTVCTGFRTTGTCEIPTLAGVFEYEVVVACIGNGLSYRAFIKYTTSASPSIPTGVWIETLAGWECPDCGSIGTGNAATAYLWYDVFVDCGLCNSADYVMGPPDYCDPDTVYSLRLYFSGQGTCL